MVERHEFMSERLPSTHLVSPAVLPADAMDLLTDILATTRTGGALFARSWLPASWGFRFDANHAHAFHIVGKGPAWLRMHDRPDFIELGDGDILLVGPDHDLASDPEAPIRKFDPTDPVLRTPPGQGSCIMCGGYSFDGDRPHPIFERLPPVIHLPKAEQDGAIVRTLELLVLELDGPGAGAQTLVGRLVDALLVYLLRHWIARSAGQPLGWLGALRDPVLARAIGLMHKRLDEPWTLASLAQASGASRAALARNFSDVVGIPPMQYLTTRRLETARHLLRTSSMSLDEIAERVGYAAGLSLSKAFRRVHGEPPGAFRERVRFA